MSNKIKVAFMIRVNVMDLKIKTGGFIEIDGAKKRVSAIQSVKHLGNGLVEVIGWIVEKTNKNDEGQKLL